ncbi:unnamed protein product [Mesocestoides corti]|uniref:Uncharacterized protein n=1 Tax=Mesocestoides corti TaxID=53468 RepID=A0A158QVQ1_MESCO|nr:unnamed protein product [Mesocestoides corti]
MFLFTFFFNGFRIMALHCFASHIIIRKSKQTLVCQQNHASCYLARCGFDQLLTQRRTECTQRKIFDFFPHYSVMIVKYLLDNLIGEMLLAARICLKELTLFEPHSLASIDHLKLGEAKYFVTRDFVSCDYVDDYVDDSYDPVSSHRALFQSDMSYSDSTKSKSNSDISLASDPFKRAVQVDGDKRISEDHSEATRESTKQHSTDAKLKQTRHSDPRTGPTCLIERKYHLLQAIVQEYSRLVGLTLEEFEITGVWSDGCGEIRRAYDEAVDALECCRIHLELLAATAVGEGENTSGLIPESKRSLAPKEGTNSLSPKALRNLVYGSLQNIVQAHDKQRKYSTGVLDFSKKSRQRVHSRWRARSVPRELSLAEAARGHSPTPVQWRSTLRGWFSVKTLTGSLFSLNAKSLAGAQKHAKANNGQPASLFEADPAKPNGLITWKSVDSAAQEKRLKATMMRSMDTLRSRKLGKNCEDCDAEQRNTLIRLYTESEQPKEALQTSWSRRKCRRTSTEASAPSQHRRAIHEGDRPRLPSTPLVTHRQSNGGTSCSSLNRSVSLNGEVHSHEPTFSSPEPPGGPISKLSRCPTCSTRPLEFANSSKLKVSYPSIFSKSTSNTSNGTPLNAPYHNGNAQAGVSTESVNIFESSMIPYGDTEPVRMAQPSMWRGSLLTVVIISLSEAVTETRVEVIIELTDYENFDDRTHHGRACDFSFLPFLDSCDPQFSIDVTGVWMANQSANYTEPIISDQTQPHINTRRLRSVYYMKKQLSSLPIEVEFHVVVDDIDPKGSTLIEDMEYKVQLNGTTKQRLQLGKHVKLTLGFEFRCLPTFYGPRCEVLCQPKPLQWDCDTKSGAQICLVDCGHGTCEIPPPSGPACACLISEAEIRLVGVSIQAIYPLKPMPMTNWMANVMDLSEANRSWWQFESGIRLPRLSFSSSCMCEGRTSCEVPLHLAHGYRRCWGLLNLAKSRLLAASNLMYTANTSRPLPPPSISSPSAEDNEYLLQRDHPQTQPPFHPQQISLYPLPPPLPSHATCDGEIDEGSAYEELEGDAYQVPKECQDDYAIMASIPPPSPPRKCVS